MNKNLIISIFAVTVLLSSAAFAKPEHAQGKGNGNGKNKNIEKSWKYDHGSDYDYPNNKRRRGNDKVLINLDSSRVDVIRSELRPHYAKKCPPGLAKKHNGCLPPGQAKKYRVGYPLPDDMVYWDVPYSVLERLPAAPPHSRYVWVDKDILLISEGSKKVLDAMVLFSGVN